MGATGAKELRIRFDDLKALEPPKKNPKGAAAAGKPEEDLEKPQAPAIEEFPYMSTRLRRIDWQAVIDKGKQWEDPYFKAGKDLILDPMMRRVKRVQQWEKFVWKRPKDVYGEGNFKVFNDIKPDDIK